MAFAKLVVLARAALTAPPASPLQPHSVRPDLVPPVVSSRAGLLVFHGVASAPIDSRSHTPSGVDIDIRDTATTDKLPPPPPPLNPDAQSENNALIASILASVPIYETVRHRFQKRRAKDPDMCTSINQLSRWRGKDSGLNTLRCEQNLKEPETNAVSTR